MHFDFPVKNGYLLYRTLKTYFIVNLHCGHFRPLTHCGVASPNHIITSFLVRVLSEFFFKLGL